MDRQKDCTSPLLPSPITLPALHPSPVLHSTCFVCSSAQGAADVDRCTSPERAGSSRGGGMKGRTPSKEVASAPRDNQKAPLPIFVTVQGRAGPAPPAGEEGREACSGVCGICKSIDCYTTTPSDRGAENAVTPGPPCTPWRPAASDEVSAQARQGAHACRAVSVCPASSPPRLDGATVLHAGPAQGCQRAGVRPQPACANTGACGAASARRLAGGLPLKQGGHGRPPCPTPLGSLTHACRDAVLAKKAFHYLKLVHKVGWEG